MPTPNIQSIVTETHKQIKNLKIIKSKSKPAQVQLGLSELNGVYLELLGFMPSPRLYPHFVEKGIHLPVIVTGVTARDYENAILLVESVHKYLHNKTVVIFDLGLGSYELLKLKKQCNSTDVCLLRSLDFDKFPSHLRNHMYMHAYLPVIIQQALNDYGAIMWVGRETEEFFITGEINTAIAQAQQSGIVAWTLETGDATSTLTHPRMFAYFKTEALKYRFQHMVSSSHLIIYNTNKIHTNVMLPWVQCALSYSCISPVGAESSYCSQRKPRYLYSGCHHYDESALNIILGQAFNFAENDYTYAGTSVIFGRETTTNSSFSSLETTAKYSESLSYA